MPLRLPFHLLWLCASLVLLLLAALPFLRGSFQSLNIPCPLSFGFLSTNKALMDTLAHTNDVSVGNFVGSKETSQATETLPPLTDHEERQYNQLARRMEYFHTALQTKYETAYELADGSFNKRGMSLMTFLDSVDEFKMHLTTHHDIEERYIFPTLGERMPEFRPNERHKISHTLMHDGLDRLEAAVNEFKASPATYKPEVLRGILDSFRDVLYDHLAEEVHDLSAQNMRKYWTIPELTRIHF